MAEIFGLCEFLRSWRQRGRALMQFEEKYNKFAAHHGLADKFGLDLLWRMSASRGQKRSVEKSAFA